MLNSAEKIRRKFDSFKSKNFQNAVEAAIARAKSSGLKSFDIDMYLLPLPRPAKYTVKILHKNAETNIEIFMERKHI